MKIGIDAGCLGITDKRLRVGVYTTTFNLIKEWSKVDKNNNQLLLYSFYQIPPNIMKSFGRRVKNIIVRPIRGWNHFSLPLRLWLDKPDFFIGPSQSLPLFLPCPALVIVHDLGFEHYSECYPNSYRQLRRISLTAIKKAKYIVAVSKATKKDLVKFYGAPLGKIRVLYQGPGECFRPSKTPPKCSYFLFVGALKPIKNIPRLLRAYSIFLKKTGKNIPLLLAGGDLWLDQEIFPTVQKLKLQDRVKFLGYVNQKKLVNLYQNALAFVSPSLYEGFGMTLLEAMACDCPVIAGNAGGQSEVVGEGGILVNPKNEKEIAEALIKIATSRKLRNKLILLGRRQLSLFSWSNFVEKIMNLIKF